MIIYYTYDEMGRFFRKDMEKNEAVYQLILGNMNNAKRKKELGEALDEQMRFGAIFDGDVPVYYFNNTPPYNMVVLPTDPQNPVEPERFGKELAQEFMTNGIELTGIQCIKEFGESFKAHYSLKNFHETMGMDIMVARIIKQYALEGEVVRASLEDIDEVSQLYGAFVEEALGDKLPSEVIHEQMQLRLSNPATYVWLYKVNNKIVGMNMSTRKLTHGICVNGVYTKPEERGKGYCKQMVSWVSQYYLDNGNEFVTLYVDKKNPFSNAAYTAIGFDYICSTYCFEEE